MRSVPFFEFRGLIPWITLSHIKSQDLLFYDWLATPAFDKLSEP